jgi:hypothetical protein
MLPSGVIAMEFGWVAAMVGPAVSVATVIGVIVLDE